MKFLGIYSRGGEFAATASWQALEMRGEVYLGDFEVKRVVGGSTRVALI